MEFLKKSHTIIPSKFSDQSILQARWLIRARLAIAVSTLLILYLAYLTDFFFDLPFRKLFLTTLSLMAFNGLYYLHIKKLEPAEPLIQEKKALGNIHFQIGVDFLVLTLMIHFSGGIENPAIIFYVFHIIIGGIILPVRSAILMAVMGIAMFATLVSLQYFEVIGRYPLFETSTPIQDASPLYLTFALIVFTLTSMLIVYFTVTLAQRMRAARAQLRQANQELLRQDTIKNEYVYRVTHNIKSDLSSISSTLSVVNQQILGPLEEKNADFVGRAYERTRKLMHFIDDLLSLTSMRLSNRFDVARFNISEVTSHVFEQMQIKAQDKNLDYTFDKPEQPVYIKGVKVSIQEAIMNLVSNAIKYTPEKGKVKLTLQSFKDTVIVRVKDSGQGIDEEDLPKIFDEFYRAGSVSDLEGAGIGLSLVKAIVERHKGRIRVHSRVNEGSEFSLLLQQNL